jgi:Zn finger protein HypA/HybF involved in hydrogenase expression
MILVVLLVIFAGLALLAFTGIWVFPRLAARLHLSEMKLVALCGLFIFLSFSTYAAWQVECPYCHNSDANVKGQCVKRQRDGSCGEDYYETHFNKSSCPWCRSAGFMTRIGAWLD